MSNSMHKTITFISRHPDSRHVMLDRLCRRGFFTLSQSFDLSCPSGEFLFSRCHLVIIEVGRPADVSPTIKILCHLRRIGVPALVYDAARHARQDLSKVRVVAPWVEISRLDTNVEIDRAFGVITRDSRVDPGRGASQAIHLGRTV